MTEEQKIAVCHVLNILIALADHTGMKDTATIELIAAAKTFGIEPEDLIQAAKGATIQ